MRPALVVLFLSLLATRAIRFGPDASIGFSRNVDSGSVLGGGSVALGLFGRGRGTYSLGPAPHTKGNVDFNQPVPASEDAAPEDWGIRPGLWRAWGVFDLSKVKRLAFWNERPLKGRTPFDLYHAETTSGPRLIKRFHPRNPAEVQAANNEVQSLLAMDDKDVFLDFYGTEYRDCDGCGGTGVLTMTQPAEGSLKDVLQRHKGKLRLANVLDFFVDVSDGLSYLKRERIPHDPPTSEDVLVVGSMDDLERARVVLCSSLTNTAVRICRLPGRLWRKLAGEEESLAVDPELGDIYEMERADVQSLGSLLRQMLLALDGKERETFAEVTDKLGSLSSRMAARGHRDVTLSLQAVAWRVKFMRWTLGTALASGRKKVSVLSRLGEHLGARLWKPRGVSAKHDTMVVDAIQDVVGVSQDRIWVRALEPNDPVMPASGGGAPVMMTASGEIEAAVQEEHLPSDSGAPWGDSVALQHSRAQMDDVFRSRDGPELRP